MEQDTRLPEETSIAAENAQIEALRQMGLSGRAKLTFELCRTLRRITREGIRYRHPDYTDEQVTQGCLRLILDNDLFEQIFPGSEIKPSLIKLHLALTVG